MLDYGEQHGGRLKRLECMPDRGTISRSPGEPSQEVSPAQPYTSLQDVHGRLPRVLVLVEDLLRPLAASWAMVSCEVRAPDSWTGSSPAPKSDSQPSQATDGSREPLHMLRGPQLRAAEM